MKSKIAKKSVVILSKLAAIGVAASLLGANAASACGWGGGWGGGYGGYGGCGGYGGYYGGCGGYGWY
jgi:hypothetical protein